MVKIGPHFRVRWMDGTNLRLIPHAMPQFFDTISEVLTEELEWSNNVKPRDESCCLLLPECAFTACADVKHLWTAASLPGMERIRLAARAREQFRDRHWLPRSGGARVWTDADDRAFDHRGARHAVAPFPRAWKFSYQVMPGFHFDVMSTASRPFSVQDHDARWHRARGHGHINIDPHGWIRV